MAMDTGEFLGFEGLPIRYLRAGKGPPVVLLHNGGTSKAIWKDVIPLLEGFEVFALDLLGFGQSAKPGRGYELERHVAILEAFLDDMLLTPAFLVGNCMGSATSLSYAIRRPGAVRGMVLINPLTTATVSKGIYGKLLGLPQRAPRLVSALSHIPLGSTLGRFGVRSQLGRHGRARRIHTRKELAGAYAGAAQSRALLEVLRDLPEYAALDRFTPPPGFPPICTVWGLENRVLRATEGKALVNTLRPARQVWLDGCGHLPMLERPERVAEVIQEFFTTAISRGRSVCEQMSYA